ncbi:hypothetical protein Syun_021818 [Stephania yunnanensis]|uniref:Uncharacterized protein n=1 Tax=Stephania yunnanensis TaxID=152371 RepID=A0AAP0IHR3_9MAGN
MPPKRNQQRIEEVYDRNNLNRQIGPLIDQRMVAVVEQLTAKIDQLLDRHMDRILPFERTDSVGSARRRRDSHRGSREFVRWGSEDLRRPSGHSKQGGYQLSSEESSWGFAPSRAGKRSAEEESGFRPSALRGGDGKYYACGGRATKGSFSQRDWRGGHGSEQGHQHDVTVQTPVHEFDDSGSKATPRKRLVKKSGDRERTPDLGIEDEKPAFMRDVFASEPPSSYGIRLRADYEDDQEGVRTMDDDNFIDDTWNGSGDWYGSDNEGFIGDAPRLEKGHGTRESLDILLGKAISYNPQ